jgi:ribosomal protein S18 acetylase RimI-like enzyme
MFREAGRDEQVLQTMTTHFLAWLQPRLDNGTYFGFVAMDNEIPVAGIGLMLIDWPPHPSHPDQGSRGYVLNVYVEPGHRRRGIAQMLMEYADAAFAKHGVHFAILHATEMGRDLYAGLGWNGTTEMAKRLGG